MRKKLAGAVVGAALIASFGPTTSASAVCMEAYYRITGDCSPCNTAGRGYSRAQAIAERHGVDLPNIHCAA